MNRSYILRWTPPGWLFGPVWSVLYASMGTASWLVWRAGGGAVPLGAYFLQLALNFAWSPLFFSGKTGLALVDIVSMEAAIIYTANLFHAVSPMAGYLMVPYSVWVAYATALNLVIWKDNRPATAKP